MKAYWQRSFSLALASLLLPALVSITHAQDSATPEVDSPTGPGEKSDPPTLVDEVFVTSINENRSVYVINKNDQAIDVFLYCESPTGWQNHFAMVNANSHKLICDNVVNTSVYFWAKSENGKCIWDGQGKEDSKAIVHPVDNMEYETLHYDFSDPTEAERLADFFRKGIPPDLDDSVHPPSVRERGPRGVVCASRISTRPPLRR